MLKISIWYVVLRFERTISWTRVSSNNHQTRRAPVLKKNFFLFLASNAKWEAIARMTEMRDRGIFAFIGPGHFGILKCYHFDILNNCHFGILKCYHFDIFNSYHFDILNNCHFGILKCYHFEIVNSCHFDIPQYYHLKV